MRLPNQFPAELNALFRRTRLPVENVFFCRIRPMLRIDDFGDALYAIHPYQYRASSGVYPGPGFARYAHKRLASRTIVCSRLCPTETIATGTPSNFSTASTYSRAPRGRPAKVFTLVRSPEKPGKVS